MRCLDEEDLRFAGGEGDHARDEPFAVRAVACGLGVLVGEGGNWGWWCCVEGGGEGADGGDWSRGEDVRWLTRPVRASIDRFCAISFAW